MEVHLGTCARCQREAVGLKRLHTMLRQVVGVSAEPDWTGFWPGIVRGIEDGRRPAIGSRPRWWSPQWALGGTAVAGAAALSLALWFGPWATRPEESVVVTSADTQYPGGAMVYHTPDKVAVVWVFDE
jgi:hypothetical protein